MGTFRLNAKNAGKVAPRVATKIVPVAKRALVRGSIMYFFFLKKNFTNFDRLDIKINLVPSVFLLSTCQIALIKRNCKRRKLKKVKTLKKKMSRGSVFKVA